MNSIKRVEAESFSQPQLTSAISNEHIASSLGYCQLNANVE